MPVPMPKHLMACLLCALALLMAPQQPASAQPAKPDKRAAPQPAVKAALAVPAAAREPVIDFDDLQSNEAGGGRLTVSANGAANAINSEVEMHGERHNAAIDRRRAAAASRSSDPPDPPQRGGAGSNSAPAAKAAAAQPKSYSCTIYCNSTSGPTVQRRFSADSRSDAARQAGDLANQICQSSGYARSSSKSFSESQCRQD